MNHTLGYGTFVPRSTPTAPSIRSPARWNERRDLRMAIAYQVKLDKLDALLAQT